MNTVKLYDFFDKEHHLLPEFDSSLFESLRSWEFGWAILEPINIASSRDDDKELSRRFSPGQKALYFFWYLDAQVTNGGFIQFYWNYYQDYIPAIIAGLKLIGDTALLTLVEEAQNSYIRNKEKFDFQRNGEDWQPLYDELKEFEEYDQLYYKTHNATMDLFEKYIRQNPSEFVKLKRRSIFQKLFKPRI